MNAQVDLIGKERQMVTVTLHMALSLNGMSARENDDTDFLAHDNWLIFVELARRTGR